MGLLSPSLGQMPLNVAVLMDRIPLVHQPAAQALPQSLDDPLAAIGDKEDALG